MINEIKAMEIENFEKNTQKYFSLRANYPIPIERFLAVCKN